MAHALVVLLVGGVFFVIGHWADGWDFSVTEIVTGGEPEFSWRSVVAILVYGVAGTMIGLGLGLFRMSVLEARGLDPSTPGEIGVLPSKTMGYTLLVSLIMLFLSIPAAIGLCIWQYVAS